jgi:hypothetical protein
VLADLPGAALVLRHYLWDTRRPRTAHDQILLECDAYHSRAGGGWAGDVVDDDGDRDRVKPVSPQTPGGDLVMDPLGLIAVCAWFGAPSRAVARPPRCGSGRAARPGRCSRDRVGAPAAAAVAGWSEGADTAEDPHREITDEADLADVQAERDGDTAAATTPTGTSATRSPRPQQRCGSVARDVARNGVSCGGAGLLPRAGP